MLLWSCLQVVGIVTRKDLARYRMWSHRGTTGLEEVHILDSSGDHGDWQPGRWRHWWRHTRGGLETSFPLGKSPAGDWASEMIRFQATQAMLSLYTRSDIKVVNSWLSGHCWLFLHMVAILLKIYCVWFGSLTFKICIISKPRQKLWILRSWDGVTKLSAKPWTFWYSPLLQNSTIFTDHCLRTK